MARAKVTKRYFNFIGGVNSDGSPLQAPENTSRILQNVELHASGRLSRRLGLDYEENFVKDLGPYWEPVLRNSAVDFLEWTNVAGDGRRNFYVVRVGFFIFIYDQSGLVTSANLLESIDFISFTTDLSEGDATPIQVASGKGILFVTGELIDPFTISYDPATQTFTTTALNIQIRDFEGVPDLDPNGLGEVLAIDERPVTLTQQHRYNLENQGWGKLVQSFSLNTYDIDYDTYKQQTNTTNEQGAAGVYPSNSDIASLAMSVHSDGNLKFKAGELSAKYLGTTAAPKGKFIFNAFDQDRQEASGITLVVNTPTTVRPRSTAFFAGRAWFGAVDGNIYFSQIMTDPDKAGLCYQEQDPTAEEANALLDTDGGVIPIPDAGEVYKLTPVGNALLVMASNGMWSISGGESNFTANSVAVRRVSKIGVSGGASAISAEDVVYFWADEGIFRVVSDQISGRLGVESLSQNRLDDKLRDIPSISKVFCEASYDLSEKKVFWSYHDGLGQDPNRLTAKYNAMIVYDINLNAFYDYRIEDIRNGSGSFMAGHLKASIRNEGSSNEFVTVNGVIVTANAVDVTTNVVFTGTSGIRPKVLTFAYDTGTDRYKITFSEFCSRSFHDWFSEDGVGVDYKSIIETNPETLGAAESQKQATYLTTFYDYSRNSYGRALSDPNNTDTGPRPDATQGFRSSQSPVEVLVKVFPLLRSSQIPVEVLVSVEDGLRSSQSPVEVLVKI